MISPTIFIKLVGLALVLTTLGIASDVAPMLAWLGSLGVILIFLANFLVNIIPHRSIVHVMVGSGLLFSGWALLNVGTWWGWLGLFLVFVIVEFDGEEV